ncbi:3-oxoacyl-[acyl-carrier-protein] reductase FabG-like [Lytechinus pictus]|uniref:3-oxoacyl-[acyl-carrier-protein] reductase FabG-like n=1 Tax=Lytechinus pictus TaxID=7653 RepID=UPI0030B9FD60
MTSPMSPEILGASLKGKVAVITGASSGIGAEIARHFASLGCLLALTGRNMETLQQVTNECLARGLGSDQVLQIQADYGERDAVKKTVEQIIQKFNQVDVLVNNAAVYATNTVESMTLDNFDLTFRVNVRAPLELTQLLTPYLIKSKGTVVNISSVIGRRSIVNELIYGMSKTALDHMTRCTAEELAPHGVRVNTVNPGVIETPLFKRELGITEEQVTQYFESYSRSHPMRRTGKPDDVARFVTFLASSDSSFTTGETVGIDGGHHLMVSDIEN